MFAKCLPKCLTGGFTPFFENDTVTANTLSHRSGVANLGKQKMFAKMFNRPDLELYLFHNKHMYKIRQCSHLLIVRQSVAASSAIAE